MAVGGVNHVGLHHEVVINEIGRVGVVGVDAAYLGSGHIDLGRLLLGKEVLHRLLVAQVKLGVAAGDEACARHTLGQQRAHNGAAHHATVTRDVDFLNGAGLRGSVERG